jgi:hypothetical protein
MQYIFTFHSLTPTYVSAFTRPSSVPNKQNQLITFKTSKKNYKQLLNPPEDGLVKAETYVGVKE